MGKNPKPNKALNVTGLPKQLAEKAAEFFASNANVKQLYVTADGHLFLVENAAVNHMRGANLKGWLVTPELANEAQTQTEAPKDWNKVLGDLLSAEKYADALKEADALSEQDRATLSEETLQLLDVAKQYVA